MPQTYTPIVPCGIAYAATFTHLTVIGMCIFLAAYLSKLMFCPLSYSHATYKSYTRISPLHGKENCWLFRGVYRLPHLYLTWIQRRLLIVASILPPTHTLHLLAIPRALQLRFGSSLHFTAQIALYDTADYPQVSWIRCPDLCALHLSTLV